MKILTFNKYNFLQENFNKLNESTEFADMQLGQLSNPLGPGYGFAVDPTMSIYSKDNGNTYIDNYAMASQMANDMNRVMNNLRDFISTDNKNKVDTFLDDLDEYKNIKILRVFVNELLKIDVFISFDLYEEEFFGVFKNFNGVNKPKFKSELFTDPRYAYMDKQYFIKLSSYIYKILYNWFIPTPGDYIINSDELNVKNSFGDIVKLKKDTKILVKGYNTDINNDPYLIIKHKNEIYKIMNNDYYYFKYRCSVVVN